MLLFALLLMIAAVNLCLGYGLAVYLGHGPPSLRVGWESLSAERPAPTKAVAQKEPADREDAKVRAAHISPEVAEAMDRHFKTEPESRGSASEGGPSVTAEVA
jgi:hypothetical protein